MASYLPGLLAVGMSAWVLTSTPTVLEHSATNHLLVAYADVLAPLVFDCTELSAAIGRVQLGKLPQSVAKRRASAAAISSRLRDNGAVSLGKQIAGTQGSYWWLRFALDLRYYNPTQLITELIAV